MDDNKTNGRLEYLSQEIQKVRQQLNMLGDLSIRLFDLLEEKKQLEKDAELEVI